MWNRLYRNHLIMPLPSYDTATNAWAPQADITWCIGPVRESEFVKFPNRVMTEREAITCALRRGQTWIDKRIKRLHSGSGPGRAQIIDMAAALQGHLEKADSKQPRQSQLLERRLEKTFTFDQFKSAIAASGLQISDQMLQRSYAALVKLRKNNHWSWAETRQKVEHSRQNLTLSSSPVRPPAFSRIPLTQSEWRRIG